MNILMLTNEYPNEEFPKPDWTWVVPYFCRSWVKEGHRVIAINNASSFPYFYYLLVKPFGGIIASHFGVSKKGLDERIWSKEFSFIDNGVKVYNLPMRKYKPGGKYKKTQIYTQIDKIVDVLQSNNFLPDVISGHWVNPQLDLVANLGEIYNLAHTAFVFHGDYSKENCLKFSVQDSIDKIDRIGFRNNSALVSASRYIRFNKPPFLCPSGIPDELLKQQFGKKEIHDYCLHLISAGRLVEYKNFGDVINACHNVFEDNCYTLEIAGEGPLKNELEQLIKELHEEKAIKLSGKIPRLELQRKMFDSDLFVLISTHETFGLVYLEAMLQGCIVIASRFGGVDGIIQDGINGFLCEEGNEKQLMEILRRIIAMPSVERKTISDSAIETAMAYSDSNVARRYLLNICYE